MLSSPTVILQPYGLPVYPQTTTCYPSIVQGGATQEAGPGSGDPTLPQVYAPPPSYPPPGQGPPTSVGRLPPLDFTTSHPSSEYPEHPQLRVYQGPQLEGAEALTSSNTEDVLAPVTSDPQSLSMSVSSAGGAGSGSDEEGSGKAQPKRLHVSNIPFRFRDPDLRQMFGQFGKILDVEIIFNERGSKGFGFVTFESAGEADRAREKLNGTIVEGRKIEVNNATARVVTKKPQTPLVNSEISTSGWKINPVMGAMYAPELYTGWYIRMDCMEQKSMVAILQLIEWLNRYLLPQQPTVMDTDAFTPQLRIPITTQLDQQRHMELVQWPVCTEEDITASPRTEPPTGGKTSLLNWDWLIHGHGTIDCEILGNVEMILLPASITTSPRETKQTEVVNSVGPIYCPFY
ncbi:hypothetical protein FQN60_017059 [Etheostoma spectabile]|uniref:RRM domain-containing protein n=1 Tax=Etheostoma spectabile TaxID=54343 RepID=A0A5J5DEE6_9PERO|nr:hypothetical protein FQN60_017059 [Etheostoma spectabile]